MGVRGLQTYMERSCQNVACEVNINDIVEKYRRETGRNAVIVVDGSSCLISLYGQLDWICGGQVKEYVGIFKKFIQAFVDIGVKLVFFFDGPTQAKKRRRWIERQLNCLDDVYKFFNMIEGGVYPSSLGNTKLLPPGLLPHIGRHAIRTFQGCKVHRTVKECDEEIVEYAMQNKCFAILGQDSDYVIFDGPQYYLSAIHLNVEKMTTINYNRSALAHHLNLTPGLLPLLASLVGNDIVTADDLLQFHRKICEQRSQHGRNYSRGRYKMYSQSRPYSRDVIYNVAKFIRECTDERQVNNDLPMISRRVFGNEEGEAQLRLSVSSYSVKVDPGTEPEKLNFDELKLNSDDPDENLCWEQTQKFAEINYRNGELNSMVYAIMHDLPHESGTGLEDFRRTELPPSAAVYQQLRQHIYGIILHEKPGDSQSHIVKEWCMQGKSSLNEAVSVPIISPKPGLHPGLMTLWNTKDKSEELLSKKWMLMTGAVSKDLDPDKLKSVPATLLAPTMLLFYLCHEVPSPFLECWEVEAFIATAVMLPLYSTTSLKALKISNAVPRAIQLACIFGRGNSLIKMLMDVCGRPVPPLEVSVWHYFDGKLFHTLYQKAASGCKPIDLCNHQNAELELFNLIHTIVQ